MCGLTNGQYSHVSPSGHTQFHTADIRSFTGVLVSLYPDQEGNQANVSVRDGVNFLRRLALQEMKLDDSSRLAFVQIVRVPDMLPSLFPSCSG